MEIHVQARAPTFAATTTVLTVGRGPIVKGRVHFVRTTESVNQATRAMYATISLPRVAPAVVGVAARVGQHLSACRAGRARRLKMDSVLGGRAATHTTKTV